MVNEHQTFVSSTMAKKFQAEVPYRRKRSIESGHLGYVLPESQRIVLPSILTLRTANFWSTFNRWVSIRHDVGYLLRCDDAQMKHVPVSSLTSTLYYDTKIVFVNVQLCIVLVLYTCWLYCKYSFTTYTCMKYCIVVYIGTAY